MVSRLFILNALSVIDTELLIVSTTTRCTKKKNSMGLGVKSRVSLMCIKKNTEEKSYCGSHTVIINKIMQSKIATLAIKLTCKKIVLNVQLPKILKLKVYTFFFFQFQDFFLQKHKKVTTNKNQTLL